MIPCALFGGARALDALRVGALPHAMAMRRQLYGEHGKACLFCAGLLAELVELDPWWGGPDEPIRLHDGHRVTEHHLERGEAA